MRRGTFKTGRSCCIQPVRRQKKPCRFGHWRDSRNSEMLDFCAEHGIVSDIEMIDIKNITTAYERMVKGDVRYRFVIDMATL